MRDYGKLITWNKQSMAASAWSETPECREKEISRELNGWSPEDALTTPPGVRRKKKGRALTFAEFADLFQQWNAYWTEFLEA